MTSKSLTIAGIFAASLVLADVLISVQYDATYSLPESHGLSCSGNGAKPAGTKCPKAGDVAIADCKPYLLSYSEAGCVAPVDAECVLVINDTWGCAFPQTADAETSKAYTGEGANYDKTLDAPLDVNCDVALEETKLGNHGHMDIGTSEGNNHGHMISERGNDHMTTDAAESAKYGSKTRTTEGGKTTGHDEPGHDSMGHYEPGVTSDGMMGHHEDKGHDENTEALTEKSSSYPSKDVTGNHHSEESKNAHPTAKISGAYPTEVAHPVEVTTDANLFEETLQAAHPTDELSDTEHGHGNAEVPTVATELGRVTGPGDTTARDDTTAPGDTTGTPVSPPADASETLTGPTASATEPPLGLSAYTPETPVAPPAYTTLTLASQ